MRYALYADDCLNVLWQLDQNSIDTIITDPPYGLGFMGKLWDHGVPGVAYWNGALRVAKPGAIMLAFGGPRTHHRLMVAIEDAGWEIRDVIGWFYGTGFPKSHNISKAVDKEMGAEREVVRTTKSGGYKRFGERNVEQEFRPNDYYPKGNQFTSDIPVTDLAEQWDGYGTALKPAWEPIIVAMKPLDGTFAHNAVEWGVAGLNIDGARVPLDDDYEKHDTPSKSGLGKRGVYAKSTKDELTEGRDLVRYTSRGRWPANLILDESAGEMLDKQPNLSGGIEGPSRFFYCSKASTKERSLGLEDIEPEQRDLSRSPEQKAMHGGKGNPYNRGVKKVTNNHPTVKPIKLLRYLVKLTKMPTGGVVLDPFMGSGSTGIACILEGREFVGIDVESHYVEIAKQRLQYWSAKVEESEE